MPSNISSLLWFAAIVALIPVALWLLKRTPVGGAAAGAAGLRSVGALPISPTQRIVTVEVGTGDARRWLVLGVTAQNITTLHTLVPQDDAPSTGTSAPSLASPFAPSFVHLLGRLRAKERG